VPQVDQILSRIRAFQAPILARCLGQLMTSLGGFFVTCAAMCLTLAVSRCKSDPERLVGLHLAAAG
jgi:hypothetical protein